MAETFINLPFPPSVNAMFRNLSGVGRVKTKRYKAWEEKAGWQLISQKPRKFRTPVNLLIVFGPKPGPSRSWDMSNHVKAIEDLLVKHNVIDDDNSNIIKQITCTQEPDQEGALVHLSAVSEVSDHDHEEGVAS